MTTLKDRILEILRKPAPANFSTITEDGKPWTRYVMLQTADDLTIRFASFISARKIKQIQLNPEVHIACGIDDPEKWGSYLQIQGTAIVSTDPTEKKAFWRDDFQAYFKGPDDPNFAVIIIKPYRIEYNSMDKPFEPEIWEA